MKLNAKKISELYASISDPIMDERIRFKGHDELDEKLFHLQIEIWRRVRKVLKLDD